MVGVCYPNGYGLIFQVENLTGAGGSYCGPGTVEARLIKCGGDDVVADLMWPPGKPLPLTGGTVAGGIGFPYQDAEACQELARRVRGLPARDKTERF
jgi:hypothetical protein